MWPLSRLREAGSAAEAAASCTQPRRGAFSFRAGMRPSRCTYVQSTVMYGESTPTQRCVDGDQRPQHSLKRAVERSAIWTDKTPSSVCVSGQLVRPSNISDVDTSKIRNSNQFHGINSPLLAFYATGQSLDVRTLCNATLWGSLLEVAVAVGFLSAPKPIPKTQIRSLASASQNLSDLDHVRGESCTLNSLWGGSILVLSPQRASGTLLLWYYRFVAGK